MVRVDTTWSGFGSDRLLVGYTKTSTKPPTTWETVVLYTQLPGSSVANFLGHFEVIDRLAQPLSASWRIASLAVGFLLQAVVFALPFWAVARCIRWRQYIRRNLQ